MSSIFGGVRTIIIYNPHFVADVPLTQSRGRSRKKHRTKMRQSSSSNSVVNNNLTTFASTDHNDNDILPGPDLTRSEPHQQQQQPPPSSSQGTTTVNHSIPVVLQSPDFPICDDRSEIDPDDRTISGDNNFSPSSGALCTPVAPPAIPNRNRNQKTRRGVEDSKKAESSFTPPPPRHAKPHLPIEPSQEQKQNKRRRKRKHAPSEPEGTLPMSSNEDLSVSSGSRAVRHCGVNGPLFTLLAPSPAPLASSPGSSCATASSFTSTATTTGTTRRK